jgi:hypothetical protein
MAAGDRKVKVVSVDIARANPVRYEAQWQLFIENKIGVDVYAAGGRTVGSFGTPAAWRTMTGLQMETQVNADCAADTNVPPRESLT